MGVEMGKRERKKKKSPYMVSDGVCEWAEIEENLGWDSFSGGWV